MKRLIIFIISFLPLLSLAQELEIIYDFPSKITVDEEITVNIQINKYDLNRFGKYQQIVPDGVLIKKIEDANAEFSFENNVITFLWSQLPEDSIIEISYKFTADSTLRGTFFTQGNFIYFFKNMRGVVSTTNSRVKVTNNYSISSVKTSSDKKDTKNTTKEVTTTTEDEIKTTKNETTETSSNCDVTVLRNMKIANYKNVTVSLVISKCNYSGIAIIQEKIPENFTIVTSKIDNCTYEQDLGYLEINISKMSSEASELALSYTLISKENLTENPVITGKCKYFENESLKSVSILEGKTTGKLAEKKEVETKTEIINEEPKTDNGEEDILNFLNENN